MKYTNECFCFYLIFDRLKLAREVWSWHCVSTSARQSYAQLATQHCIIDFLSVFTSVCFCSDMFSLSAAGGSDRRDKRRG